MKPLFDWSEGDIEFVALKREEAWGMVVTSTNVTFFQYQPNDSDLISAVGKTDTYDDSELLSYEFNYKDNSLVFLDGGGYVHRIKPLIDNDLFFTIFLVDENPPRVW